MSAPSNHPDIAAMVAEAERVAVETEARRDAELIERVLTGSTPVQYREIVTQYGVDGVEITQHGQRLRLHMVEVKRATSTDPDDPEPYVQVTAYGQHLTVNGKVDQRYPRDTPVFLPAALADRLAEREEG